MDGESSSQGGGTGSSEDADARKRWRKWVLAAIASVVLAAATGLAGGLGSRAADLIGSGDSPLLSYSTMELGSQCAGGIFVPGDAVDELAQRVSPEEWTVLEEQPGAAYADWDPVQVSIQGESARTITLTGIEFKVQRRPRPPGAVFNAPCGGASVGYALDVDLDAHPPRVVDSSGERDGMLGSRGVNGERLTRAIRFPWTVSITDPLLLDVVARTEGCYCTWSAAIPWVSGGERGTILIDNGGEGYRVVNEAGLSGYSAYRDGWVS